MTCKTAALTLAVVALMIGESRAAWRVEIESKTVVPNQTGVTVNVTVAWDLKLQAVALPMIARSLDPGAFWAGTLPYDTADFFGDRYTHGVSWNPSVPPWAVVYMGLLPRAGWMTPCGGGDSGVYDGISPDRFSIDALSFADLAAQPSGVTFIAIQFDVTGVPGQFEFDTACFTPPLNKIFLIDNFGVDHGPPPGANEVVFTKGVITISAPLCDCSHQGDCNGNGLINLSDIVFLISHAFGMGAPPLTDTDCPALNRGDWNCDGRINIADIVGMVAYLYRNGPGPCDPCGTK